MNTQRKFLLLLLNCILILWLGVACGGAKPTPTPTPFFSYIVIAQNEATGDIVTSLTISIELSDKTILEAVTDVKGKAFINIPIQYQNQPFTLRSESKGFKKYVENITPDTNVSESHTILLKPIESGVVSAVTQIPPTEAVTNRPIPTDTPTSTVIETTPPENISTPVDTPIPTITETTLPENTPTPVDTPVPTITETTLPENTPTPVDTPTLTPILPVVNTPTPQAKTPPTVPPKTITANPSGKLAISLKFGFDSRIYLTAFDGKGLNGEQPNSIPDAKQPMWSSDGNYVMVNAKVNGVQGLFKLNAIAFNPEVVIERGSARWPVLSSDGKEIIFSEETLQDAMFRRQADGNIIQVWLNNRQILAQRLLWSDNNILVFQGCKTWEEGHEGECGTWASSASNLNPQRITEGNDDFPMDAKSGKLALMNAKDGDWEVYIMPLAGPRSQAINLTNNTASDGMPAISPDGKLVAYISNESGSWAVWTVTVEGTNKKKWFDINSERGTVDVQTWVDDRMSWTR